MALEDQADLEPVYEAQMRAEVERILAAIPADQLAIQWDARYEFAMFFEGAIAVWFDEVEAGAATSPLSACSLLPSTVCGPLATEAAGGSTTTRRRWRRWRRRRRRRPPRRRPRR